MVTVRRFPILPIPKPTATQRSKRYKLKAFYKYRDDVNALGIPKYLRECGCHVIYVLPMPRSWSMRKRHQLAGTPHQVKPDRSNLDKALEDACTAQDQKIWDMRSTKIWGYEGEIRIILATRGGGARVQGTNAFCDSTHLDT